MENLNPEQDVILRGYEGGYYDPQVIHEITVAVDFNEAWYYGPHENIDDCFVKTLEEEGKTWEHTKNAYLFC